MPIQRQPHFPRLLMALILTVGIFAVFVALLPGCATMPTPPTETPPGPETPATPDPGPAPTAKLPWGDRPEWTDHLIKELRAASALLGNTPADAAAWCPTFANLTQDQRAVFYATLIAEAVRWESGFNPAAAVYECRTGSCVYSGGCRYVEGRGYCMKGGHALDGGLVVSRGLMQMSLESAQGIGCAVSTPADLNDPLKNLSCTVRGFNRYIPSGGNIAAKVGGSWKGAAVYWAVFRDSSEYVRKSRAAIQAAGKKYCSAF